MKKKVNIVVEEFFISSEESMKKSKFEEAFINLIKKSEIYK